MLIAANAGAAFFRPLAVPETRQTRPLGDKTGLRRMTLYRAACPRVGTNIR